MVMAEESKVFKDHLFVGLTKPPMLFGVSYTFFVVNAFLSLVSFILYNDFRVFLISVPIHGIGYYLSAKEPLFLELFMLKQAQCNRSKNTLYHGGNSYDPY